MAGAGRARFDYDGCAVLVTGGTSGIGAAIARAFTESGASVTVTGTRPGAADYEVDLTPFAYQRCRLTEVSDIAAVAERTDRLDILVNNAGSNFPGGRSEWEPDAFAEAVTINLIGAFRLSGALRATLAASELPGGGSVVNLASMASYMAVPLVPGYGAAKAGVVQMTKTLAAEWAVDGIRVNAVAPGLIDTPMTTPLKGIDALEQPMLDRTPLGRWGTPEDVAPVVLFLASAAAGFVTGQTLPVCGGYSVL